MNKAEIMTLLSSKVKPSQIRTAIMAGKLSGILMSADRSIAEANHFRTEANWEEMLRIMEGTLDKEVDYQSQDVDRPGKKRSF